MKWSLVRRSRVSAKVRRRPPMSFEQLEQRNLLSADLWHASGVYAQPTLATSTISSEQVGQGDACHVAGTQPATPSLSFSPQVLLPSQHTLGQSATTTGALSAAAVDDVFENNDTFGQAANLGSLSQPTIVNNLVMADQADWFQFQLSQSADASSTVSIQFQQSQGDLDLALYDSSGRLLNYSNGTSNSESISLAGRSAGTYYVYVYGYRGATNPHYTLTVNPRQTQLDDRFEPNNSLASAANLGSLSTTRTEQNLVMADAGDWYRFSVNLSASNNSYVGIGFQHTAGDLDLELFNSSGRRVGLSQGVTNTESISLAGMASGTYYVHVYGYRGVSNPNYSLTIAVDSSTTAPVPPTPTTPPSAQPAGGFQIDLNMSGLTAAQQAIFQQAAQQWSQAIVGDLPNMNYNGRVVDDLLIDVSASSIDGAGGVLGQAGPDRLRPGSQLPYHGSMQFDSADLAQMQANGTLLGVVMHEIGHVLGIGTIWQNLGLLAGVGSSNPTFIGAQATAAYNAAFGTHASGVPVENSGGAGTRDGHWRESVFGNELMTGYVGPGLNLPLSRVTIASLADLGYQVNLAAAT